MSKDRSALAAVCLLLLAAPALADDVHTAHLEVFCNSTGHVHLVSIDGGTYQNCEGGDCYVTLPNTTTRWLPCNQTDAAEIAEAVVREMDRYPNYQPLTEKRIDAVVINSSTFMKDSWMEWAERTLMPNLKKLRQGEDDLGNCTQKLREMEMSKQNIIDRHQPEIKAYEDRIERLESDETWYQRFLLGSWVIALLFILMEKGVVSKNLYDRVKGRGRR